MPDTVAGLVLAAGGSARLGRPKQLLPFRGGTLLDAVLATARACPFDQRVVALGGSAEDVRAAAMEDEQPVPYARLTTTSNPDRSAALDPRCDVLVLMLGDQPGVTAGTVRALLAGRGDAPLAVCRYDDGRGHPFAFAAGVFGELGALHGDKAVWKLLDRRPADVAEVAVPGAVPLDVDTWADYEAVLAT